MSSKVQGSVAAGVTPSRNPDPVVTGGLSAAGVVRTSRVSDNGRGDVVCYGLDGATERAVVVDASGRMVAVGAAAVAAALAGNPIAFAGVDAGGLVQTVPVAVNGTAIPLNSLLLGGSDGALLRALLADTAGRLNTVGAAAEAAAVAGNPNLVGTSDGVNARALRSSLPTTVRSLTTYRADVALGWNGVQDNAWAAVLTGAAGVSAAFDTGGLGRVSVFGNVSGATTLTVQFSQDGVTYYDSGTTAAPIANFGITFDCAARFVRLKSSADVTASITIAAKN